MTLEAVILAAGYSSRARTFKMALDFFGKPVLVRLIETMEALCDTVIVVGGYQIEEIEKLIKGYEKVKLVYNENYPQGMFTSVKKGIKEVKADKFFLTPGDYPLVNKAVCEEILKHQGEVVIPRFNGRGGHPVLIDSKLIPEILNEPDTSHLKAYLSKKTCITAWAADERILLDIDTMDDYHKALKYQTERENASEIKNKMD